jgi:hypothetical protein
MKLHPIFEQYNRAGAMSQEKASFLDDPLIKLRRTRLKSI